MERGVSSYEEMLQQVLQGSICLLQEAESDALVVWHVMAAVKARHVRYPLRRHAIGPTKIRKPLRF